MTRGDLIRVPVAALLVMVANVLVSVAVVWAWSMFVAPGLAQADYEAFAMRSAPASSVVAGIPLMLLAGFLVARGRPLRSGLPPAAAVALLYIALDVAIILASGLAESLSAWEAVSYPSKLAAALAGAAVAARIGARGAVRAR